MAVVGVTPILNVSSFAQSRDWLEKLGWRRGFAWSPTPGGAPTFGSVCTDKAELFLCQDAQGARGTAEPPPPGAWTSDGVWMAWWLESPAEVDALHAEAVRLGVVVTVPPTDMSWGVRECHIRHPDGHVFRVSAGLHEHGEE